MQKNSLIKIIFIFALIGVLFSGYLSLAKIITTKCTTKEGCVYFFGFPTCFYGFAMFLALFILSALVFFKKTKTPEKLMKGVLGVSIIGIIFSGYFIIQELFINPICPPEGCTLILPTCVYGFFVYLIIFICSYLFIKKND